MAIVLIFLIFSIGAFVFRPDFIAQDISGVFVSMVFRSVLFSASHAALTLLLVSALSVLVAFSTLSVGPPKRSIYLQTLRVLGMVFFFSPMLVAALNYLQWANIVEVLPKFGWTPIVMTHVLVNLFFLSYVFAQTFNRELSSSKNLFNVGHVFSISRSSLYFKVLWRPLLSDFFAWGPLVFWWCFSAFTSVLVLGGGPRYSSPEVLLYYLLGSSDRPSRLLFLIIVQCVCGFLFFLFAKKRKSQKQMLFSPVGVESFLVLTPTRLEKSLFFLGWLVFVGALVFWTPLVFRSFQSVLTVRVEASMIYSTLSLLIKTLVVGLMSLVVAVRFSKKVYLYKDVFVVLSPMMLLAVILQFPLTIAVSQSLKEWILATLFVWTSVPILAAWVLKSKNLIWLKFNPTLKIFNPGLAYKLRYLFWPLVGLSLFGFFQLLILVSLGDVGLTSILLGSQNPTLAQGIYSRVTSYQFDAAFALFGYLILASLPLCLMIVHFMRRYGDR